MGLDYYLHIKSHRVENHSYYNEQLQKWVTDPPIDHGWVENIAICANSLKNVPRHILDRYLSKEQWVHDEHLDVGYSQDGEPYEMDYRVVDSETVYKMLSDCKNELEEIEVRIKTAKDEHAKRMLLRDVNENRDNLIEMLKTFVADENKISQGLMEFYHALEEDNIEYVKDLNEARQDLVYAVEYLNHLHMMIEEVEDSFDDSRYDYDKHTFILELSY